MYQTPKHTNFQTFFYFDSKPDIEFFCFLETSLAFEKATNLAYWKAKLNLRIFVYIENKTKNWDKFQIFVIGAQGLTQNGPYGPQAIGPIVWSLQGPPGTHYICFFNHCLDNIFKLRKKNQNLKEKFSNYFKMNRYESNTHNTAYLFI